jgi:LSD1 subclass zinc finger protein
MRQYYVFMCSNCRRFTNAPVGRKHRRCSYCGKIVNILKANVALFQDQHEAIAAVQKFNASGSDEFEKAVEHSRDKVRSLMPAQPIGIEELSREDSFSESIPAGRMNRLLALLETMARTAPCNLDDLKLASEKQMLEWDWVEQTLSKLADEGSVAFPRPWSVQMVRPSSEGGEKAVLRRDLTKEIRKLLQDNGGEMSVTAIGDHYEKAGISWESVEPSLNILLQTGIVFEPRPGVLRLV